MLDRINGINIAVKDLEEAARTYEKVFGVPTSPLGSEEFAFPGLLGARLELNGFQINLITSVEPGTSVAKFLEKYGEGVFLLSVLCDDIDAEVETLEGKGVRPLFSPAMKGDFGGATFLHPKDLNGVQLEILQPSN